MYMTIKKNNFLNATRTYFQKHFTILFSKQTNPQKQVKKGKMNVDSVLKNIDTLMPDELREDTKRAITVCKDAGAGIKDYCDAAYTILKCFFTENPKFFFPWNKIKTFLERSDDFFVDLYNCW